jgi:hypothetical protein
MHPLTGIGSNRQCKMHDRIKKILKNYDEAFKKAGTSDYKITLTFSTDGLSFCCFDTITHKYLSIESVGFKSSPEQVNLELVEEFLNENDWLKNKFESFRLLYETTKSTLIPAPLFEQGDQDYYASLNFKISDSDIILFDKLSHLDAYNLYPIPSKIKNKLLLLFSGCVLSSHSSCFIETLLIMFKHLSDEKRIFVNVRTSYLDIVILEGKNLRFFNSFYFKTNEDFIYYVLFVMEQLNINPKKVELFFSGLINKNSRLFEMAYKYVAQIHFLSLPESFTYSYIFNDIPGHHYFNLLSAGLCES